MKNIRIVMVVLMVFVLSACAQTEIKEQRALAEILRQGALAKILRQEAQAEILGQEGCNLF